MPDIIYTFFFWFQMCSPLCMAPRCNMLRSSDMQSLKTQHEVGGLLERVEP